MVTSYLVNAVTAFATILILLFFMGDPDKALNTPSGWPIIEIFYQAAGTLSGMNALMSMILVLGIIAYFNGIASVSRLTWAFGMAPHLPTTALYWRLADDANSSR